jgi:hypothetical protein
VLEKFHLAETLFRFLFGFVRAAKVFTLLGQNLISTFDFLNHGSSQVTLAFSLRLSNSTIPYRETPSFLSMDTLAANQRNWAGLVCKDICRRLQYFMDGGPSTSELR